MKGDREHQLQAVDALHGMNLRSCLDLIRAYLETDPDPLASALLIDSLIDQQISEELTLNRDGLCYTFIPRYQEEAAESDGFLQARALIREWLENENPSLFNLCEQVLIREAYLARCRWALKKRRAYRLRPAAFISYTAVCRMRKAGVSSRPSISLKMSIYSI